MIKLYPLLPWMLSCLSLYGFAQVETKLYDVEHYTFHIEISDRTDKINGLAEIFVKINDPKTQTLTLDLVDIASGLDGKGMHVKSVKKKGRSLSYNHKDNKLSIALNETLEPGQMISLSVAYAGIPADGLIIDENKYGDRTFFGDNWPDRARHWLPTVDHPADKATCEFIVTAPAHYQVIANGMLREESNLLDFKNREELKVTHWVNRIPIPTKVMVMGVARFAVLHAEQHHHIPIQYWVYPEDREAGFSAFEPSANILQFFSTKLGPYPYDKLAQVESKTNYGGMENASNIFYSEEAIHTRNKLEALIAHEIAHQWFGNSLTESDWSHVWLSEGFATYLSHLYFEHTYGRDSLAALLKEDKERIFAFHLKSPETTVVDTATHNLFKLLNANSYQKGSWFLHMLRSKTGDDLFWKGLRLYYQRYKESNANTEDFRKIMEEVSGQNLAAFFNQWLNKPGHPYITGSWKYNGFGKKLTISLDQSQQTNQLYDLEIQVGIYYKNVSQPEIRTIHLDGKHKTYEFKLKKSPQHIVLDPNTWVLMDFVFVET